MTSAWWARSRGDLGAFRKYMNEGLIRNVHSAYLWIMFLHQSEREMVQNKIHRFFRAALKCCCREIVVFAEYSRFFERGHRFSRSRAVLELFLANFLGREELTLEISRLEMRGDNFRVSETVVNSALSMYPCSTVLWAQFINISSESSRKCRCITSLRQRGLSTFVVFSIAVMMSFEGRVNHAISWIHRVMCVSPRDGDFLACFLLLETLKLDAFSEIGFSYIEQKCMQSTGDAWDSVCKNLSRDYTSTEMTFIVSQHLSAAIFD